MKIYIHFCAGSGIGSVRVNRFLRRLKTKQWHAFITESNLSFTNKNTGTKKNPLQKAFERTLQFNKQNEATNKKKQFKRFQLLYETTKFKKRPLLELLDNL